MLAGTLLLLSAVAFLALAGARLTGGGSRDRPASAGAPTERGRRTG